MDTAVDEPGTARHSGRGQRVALACLCVGLVVAPLVLRPVGRLVVADRATPSYLPALEASRVRLPFRAAPIDDLRTLNPDYVFIGDSMLGTRIDPGYLHELTGGAHIGFLFQAGTGSAYWYLTFKNHLIASHVKPKRVFVFFRDLNLTDPLFRATGQFRWSLDDVARSQEAVLNEVIASRVQGGWFRIHSAIDEIYGVDSAREWIERALKAWPARLVAAGRPTFEEELNSLFWVDRLRPMAAADAEAAEDAEADFKRNLPRSLLPEIIGLAREAGLPLCFVRVQRRPRAGGPPVQSAALQRYMRDLRSYLEANGALLRDDTGDPDMTLSLYEDGDHIADTRRYTALFRQKLDAVFR